MTVILRAEQITRTFSGSEPVLKGIDLAIESNTFTVLLGQSGSGKTTLLNVLSGLCGRQPERYGTGNRRCRP